MSETLKRNLNANMNYVNYTHVCKMFLAFSGKNVFEINVTHAK